MAATRALDTPGHSEFVVRSATPADRAAALRVCLLTGDEGADATSLYPADPDALGKRWVAPYLDLEQYLAFVLEEVASGRVVGYCLAARDTSQFAARLQEEYLPQLRRMHPDPDAQGVPRAAWTLEQEVCTSVNSQGPSPLSPRHLSSSAHRAHREPFAHLPGGLFTTAWVGAMPLPWLRFTTSYTIQTREAHRQTST